MSSSLYALRDRPRAHMHLSWLDPHKMRRLTVVGSERMAVIDDMETERKLTIYERALREDETFGEYVQVSGDIGCPRLPNDEPLRLECEHFITTVRSGKHAGAREPPRSCPCSKPCSSRSTRRGETGLARVGRALRRVIDARTLKVRLLKALQAGAGRRRAAGRPDDTTTARSRTWRRSRRTRSTAAASCAASTSTSTRSSPGSSSTWPPRCRSSRPTAEEVGQRVLRPRGRATCCTGSCAALKPQPHRRAGLGPLDARHGRGGRARTAAEGVR